MCQKTRLGMTNNYKSLTFNNKVDSKHSTVGIDTLTMTPMDHLGNVYLFLIVNFFTNHVFGYASPTKDAPVLAAAFFQYCCTFGLFDHLRTDPGSEFLNGTVKRLNSYLGLTFSSSTD